MALTDLFYTRSITYKAGQKVERKIYLYDLPQMPHCVLSLQKEFKYGYLDKGITVLKKQKGSTHSKAYLFFFFPIRRLKYYDIGHSLLYSKFEGVMVHFLCQFD